MSEWRVARLSDVCEIVGRGITPQYVDDGPITVVNQKCIREGRLDLAVSRRHGGRAVTAPKLIQEGDVLVNSTGVGTLGRTAAVQTLVGPTTVDTHVTIARPSTADPGWVRYLFRLLEPSIEALAEGSTGQTELSRHRLAELEVLVPSLSEQQAIAGILGALDDKIESNRRIATGCERLLSGFAALAPEDSLVPMSEIAQSTRISVNPTDLGDELVDHFSIPAFDTARLPELCSASTIMSGKFLVERRSVLVSRLNPSTPRVWMADPGSRKAICSTEFLVLGPRDGQLLATVWLAAVSANFLAEAERRATGTSFSHQRIKPDDALTIEVPDMRLLQASQLTEAEAWLERALAARRESAAASSLRDALLPELLSGRLRVCDAEQVVEGAM